MTCLVLFPVVPQYKAFIVIKLSTVFLTRDNGTTAVQPSSIRLTST